MPLPMTPTQLTVFTKASASAASRLPCWSSTITTPSRSWSIIPLPPDYHRGAMGCARKDFYDLRAHTPVQNTNLRDQLPGESLVNEELGLAAAAAIAVLSGISPVSGLHQRPVDFVQV